MSYILDALRRAERERRGADATILETVTQVLAPPAAPPAADTVRRWLPGLALASVLLVGVVGGLLLRRSSDSPPSALIGLKPTAGQTTAPSVPPAPLPTPAAPQLAAAMPAPVPAAAPPNLTPSETLTDVPPLPAGAVAPQASEDAATLAAEAAPPEASAPPMPVAPPPVVHRRLPTGNEPAVTARGTAAGARQLLQMPDSYRAHFPSMAVDVHVYDDEPSRRFVIIGGHRYGEGETLSAGPRLVQIVPEGMVLDWQGQRVVYALAR